MNSTLFGCLILGLTASCLGQTLYPKHIETPIYYPPLARAAAISGTVTLKITIDADGKVANALVTNAHSVPQVLQDAAIDNIRLWTFEKPETAPATQVIVYEFHFDDPSLPVNREHCPITKVIVDPPDHVTILSNGRVWEPSQSKMKKQKASVP